jgi:hypothetical protein
MRKEDDPIIDVARFVTKRKKPAHVSSSNVSSTFVYGTMRRRGSGYKMLTQVVGTTCAPSKCGGGI